MSSNAYRVSVIVCTLNRAASLSQTLASLSSQNLNKSTFEVIIVDNGSTDDTFTVVQRFRQRSRLAITYILETEKGLSVSRNRGLDAARGEVVVFLDDDAHAGPEWLSAILRTLAANHDVDVIGGPVLPDPPSVIPDWLPKRLHSHLSLLNLGNRPRKLRYPHYPIGTNMAVRKNVLDCITCFDPVLGRHGDDSHRTGEETDLFLRLERQGCQIWYVPRAVVYHRMHPARLQPHWLSRQAFWIGRSTAAIERKSFPVAHVILNLVRAVILIVVDVVVWEVATLSHDRKLAFWARCILNNSTGYIQGFFRHRAGTDKKRGNP